MIELADFYKALSKVSFYKNSDGKIIFISGAHNLSLLASKLDASISNIQQLVTRLRGSGYLIKTTKPIFFEVADKLLHEFYKLGIRRITVLKKHNYLLKEVRK